VKIPPPRLEPMGHRRLRKRIDQSSYRCEGPIPIHLSGESPSNEGGT